MKKLLVLLIVGLFSLNCFSQAPPQNWFLLDPEKDNYNGVSAERAYSELLQGRTSTPVIVAVIDGGVDVEHEDLKSKIWWNTKEIPNNKIDDDKNGYVDDINGWDFIGGATQDVRYDNLEVTRLFRLYRDSFNVYASRVTPDQNPFTLPYNTIKVSYDAMASESRENYLLYNKLLKSIDALFAEIGSDNPSLEQLESHKPQSDSLILITSILKTMMKEGTTAHEIKDELESAVDHVRVGAEYYYNPDFDPRPIVGDNYPDATERYYGNNEVEGPEATHGTHVAGIIGADRTNASGIKGVADNVQIIALRCVPDGDERDKDVGNSIRYAVDMGAKVINMSFGKAFAYNKKAVDDAMKYALEKDVLLVHGSGNDGLNVDSAIVYPNKFFADGGVAPNFINVGACMWDNRVADFSNYGKKNVDVFAPGVIIYSTVPNDKYKNLQGTSMASPMVSGVAAVVRSYFPDLTAEEVKKILMKSVVKVKGKVNLPSSDEKMVKMKKLCRSGGIVNLYNAIKMAERKSKS